MSADACDKTTTDSDTVTVLTNLRDEVYLLDFQLRSGDKLSDNSMKLLMEISDKLSKVLPKLDKNSDIFEIDDLLYPDDKINDANIQSMNPDEANITFSEDCFVLFMRVYVIISEWDTNRRLDETILQVIKGSTFKHFNTIIKRANFLISTRNTKKLCLALKIMRIAIEKDSEAVLNVLQDFDTDYYSYMFISDLRKIPQARLPQQKRISTWLRNQSNIIMNIIHSKPFQPTENIQNYFELYNPEQFNPKLLSKMKHVCLHFTTFVCDHLHTFFMSAKDENERINRLKEFLIRSSSGLFDEVGELEDIEYDSRTTEVISQCLEFIQMIFDSFEYILENRMYADDELRDMERKLGCKIIPYLSRQDSVVEDKRKDEECNDSLDSDDEADYTIEKYIFFDNFVKQLEVLDAMHTACMMCNELLGTYGNAAQFDTINFRGLFTVIWEYIRMALLNPSKRNGAPWIIEILLKQCPFMIVSKGLEYLGDDLIKMLNGEEIDELTEEKLFFATNCMYFVGKEYLRM